MSFVEVPDEEFDSMGANVLAVGPRDCVMVDGNPRTRAALERAGARSRPTPDEKISPQGRRRTDLPDASSEPHADDGVSATVHYGTAALAGAA